MSSKNGRTSGKTGGNEGLTIKRLVSLAKSNVTLSPSIWKKVAQAVSSRPDLLQGLADERERVPRGSSQDPVISALRRICWPSSRLAVRHRDALRGVGSALPFSFLRLALEEARTWSWRNLNGEPLTSFTRWLLRSPLPEADRMSMAELSALGSTYEALITLRFGSEADFMPVLKRMAHLERYLTDQPAIIVEGLCAFALHSARYAKSNETAQSFSCAETCLTKVTGDEFAETKAIFHLCRGWAEGLLTSDEARVEQIYMEGLAVLTPESDPWLTLFLHHEAAKSALTFAVSRLLVPDEAQKQTWSQLDDVDSQQEAFARLQKQYFDHGTAESDAIFRALTHLEAAEGLYGEFRTDDLAIAHMWLWSHALIHTDPIRGVDSIIEAHRLAVRMGYLNRATTMVLDTVYLLCQLGRSKEPRERVQECISRATKTLIGTRPTRKAGPGGSPVGGGGQIMLPSSLLSRIGDE